MNTAEHYINTFLHTKCCVILLFILSLIPYKTFAADVCVSDDTVAVVLNWENAGSATRGSTDWRTDTGIRGTSACLKSWNYGTGQYGMVDQITEDGVIIHGGEYTGAKCWCRVVYPAVTKWIADGWEGGSASECHSRCANDCSWSWNNYPEWWRTRLFESIQN